MGRSQSQLQMEAGRGGFSFPLEAVTETFAILGKRGSGKTATAVVLTEELLAAGQQVVVVDPVGVWYGLRAAGPSSDHGLPVVILGGDHGDLPLPETSGRDLAQVLAASGRSAVLDLSHLSKSAIRRLMADFLEDLYRHTRSPLHLVVDEADTLAPQRLPRDMTRLLGAMDDVVRRGRAHGLGCTMITQRPAVLSKDVLGQAEVLIALRMNAPRDVAAIDEWVRLHADEDTAARVKASLPSLPVGTAWIWSPGWLDCLEQVAVRPRQTVDSSATPRPAAAGVARPPKALDLGDVDLDDLRRLLEPSVMPAYVGEPADAALGGGHATPDALARLRTRVDELTELLRIERAKPPRVQREVETIEVPVIDLAASEHLAGLVDRLTKDRDALSEAIADLQRLLTPVPATAQPTVPPIQPDRESPAPLPAEGSPARSSSAGSPPRAGAMRMLQAMADHHPTRLSRHQLATLARMKVTGGTFATYLSGLRRSGYLRERDGLLEITSQGFAILQRDPASTPHTSADIREQWRRTLRAGARKMLDALVEQYPGPLTRADLR